jgi:hypothetical protein
MSARTILLQLSWADFKVPEYVSSSTSFPTIVTCKVQKFNRFDTGAHHAYLGDA